jgi:hypothetical protein
MLSWHDLSNDEKASIRKLAVGHSFTIREGVLRKLARLGLVDRGPEKVTLTEAGFALHWANSPKRGPKKKSA